MLAVTADVFFFSFFDVFVVLVLVVAHSAVHSVLAFVLAAAIVLVRDGIFEDVKAANDEHDDEHDDTPRRNSRRKRRLRILILPTSRDFSAPPFTVGGPYTTGTSLFSLEMQGVCTYPLSVCFLFHLVSPFRRWIHPNIQILKY